MPRSFALIFLSILSAAASARIHPTQPIRVIVGFGPGAPDTVARLLAQQMPPSSAGVEPE